MLLKKAKEVVLIESAALREMAARIDGKFIKAIELIYRTKGRVIITGMGKAGIVGRKIAATLASTGTPSLWLHSAEAVHGDLGQVTKNDIVIVISNSGETEETKSLIPLVKRIKAKIIAITGNSASTLAKHSDIVLDIAVKKEGCPLGLAPMASTTAAMALGDAIAACLIVKRQFQKEDFAFNHPGGSLGKKLLLKVEDIMRKGSHCAKVNENSSVKKVLLAITRSRCGSACIINAKGRFVGIFTDGDLRRHLETDHQLLARKVKGIMTRNPITIAKDTLAVEAMRVMEEKKIDELPVVDKKHHLLGLLDVQDILRAGLV